MKSGILYAGEKMKRVIDTLNGMSFILPDGWKATTDKYNMMNGQGFINRENYLSDNGEVISLFEIHREPSEFFESYQSLVESYNEKVDSVVFEKEFSIKFGEFSFPVYILKGIKQPTIYIVQVFVNCGDKLGCFMFTMDNCIENNKEMISNNQTFASVTQILRTVQ